MRRSTRQKKPRDTYSPSEERYMSTSGGKKSTAGTKNTVAATINSDSDSDSPSKQSLPATPKSAMSEDPKSPRDDIPEQEETGQASGDAQQNQLATIATQMQAQMVNFMSVIKSDHAEIFKRMDALEKQAKTPKRTPKKIRAQETNQTISPNENEVADGHVPGVIIATTWTTTSPKKRTLKALKNQTNQVTPRKQMASNQSNKAEENSTGNNIVPENSRQGTPSKGRALKKRLQYTQSHLQNQLLQIANNSPQIAEDDELEDDIIPTLPADTNPHVMYHPAPVSTGPMGSFMQPQTMPNMNVGPLLSQQPSTQSSAIVTSKSGLAENS